MKKVYLHIQDYFKTFALLCLGLCAISMVNAQEVSTEIDTTQIRYGELITLSLKVELEEMQEVVFPEGQTFSPFETIRFSKIDTIYKDNMWQLKRQYGITHFDSGSYKLPKQFVLINDKPFASDIEYKIEVRTVAVDTIAQPMYDIKPVLKTKGLGFPWKTLLIVLAILAAIIGYFIYKPLKQRAQELFKKKELAPLEEAIQAFKELDEVASTQPNTKTYYSELTGIVKRYLDRKVTEDALESTTDELLDSLQLLKHSGTIPFKTDLLRDLKEVLERADLIKFANQSAPEHLREEDRKFMEFVVVETEKMLPDEEEEQITEEARLAALAKIEAEKKRKQKRIYYALGSLALVLLVGLGIFFSIQKFEKKELDTSQWITSTYGYPPLKISTPKVLLRDDELFFKFPEVSEIATFSSGKPEDKRFVMIETIEIAQGNTEELGMAIAEQAIEQMEDYADSNLLLFTDSFTMEDEAAVGLMIHGSFLDAKKNSRAYKVYLINQVDAIHKVMIIYPNEDEKEEELAEHIINSIEFQKSK